MLSDPPKPRSITQPTPPVAAGACAATTHCGEVCTIRCLCCAADRQRPQGKPSLHQGGTALQAAPFRQPTPQSCCHVIVMIGTQQSPAAKPLCPGCCISSGCINNGSQTPRLLLKPTSPTTTAILACSCLHTTAGAAGSAAALAGGSTAAVSWSHTMHWPAAKGRRLHCRACCCLSRRMLHAHSSSPAYCRAWCCLSC